MPARHGSPSDFVPSCLVVQHVEPERPYAIAEALGAAGVALDIRRTFAGEPVPPDASGFAGVVVMGGPMSARADAGFPSRRAELALLADAVRRAVPTLGVCLGAQLLALAGGGRVLPGAAGPEIGWGPVELTEEAGYDPLLAGLPQRLAVLHWHSDTFDLPPGSVHLAASARYRGQAFRVGARAWGLQFHIEVDERAVAAFLGAFGEDAVQAGTTPEAIAALSPAAVRALEPHRARVVARFAELVASPDREQLVER
jgi:GMP synthase-like glutamine amidotransferase